jgi:acetamidase/formamidase
MTMGLHTDLDEATKIATREMIDWMVEMKGLTREDAYMLASLAMDLIVTQVVDITKGIHALMPKANFSKVGGALTRDEDVMASIKTQDLAKQLIQ